MFEARVEVTPETDALLADALANVLLQPTESPAADEQDVLGVYLQEVLVRVLAPALRRDARDRALQDLQESLLDALAGNVARYGGVVALACDLVDLVDVDDPRLSLLHVEVGGLYQLEEDVLHVLTDVSRLGQGGGVGYGEGDVEDLGQRLGQEGLTAPCRTDEQYVGFLELRAVRGLGAHRDPLVVVVDGDGEDPLRLVLSDDVLVEDAVDLTGLGEVVVLEELGSRELLVYDLVTELDALVADVDARARYELPDLALALPAERALQLIRRIPHATSSSPDSSSPLVVLYDVIYDAVLDGLIGTHYVVPIRVALYSLVRLSRVLGEDLVQAPLGHDELLGVDLHVRGLPREAADARLVQEDARVG